MARHAHIVGWGKYVPAKVLTNADFARTLDTSDEWIRSRTGIVERHMASPRESTYNQAVKAAWSAIHVADIAPSKLELIVVATVSPDFIFPATSYLVQDSIGATHAAAFDINSGCTGFVYALAVASDLIVSGAYSNALVVGAETLTRFVDYKDRGTCILFGDGAGAVILQATDSSSGMLSSVLGADGSGGGLLQLPAGGSRNPASHETVKERMHYIKMNGNEVFRFAVASMTKATNAAVAKAGLTMDDISLVIPHQANLRIIQSAAKNLKVPMEKMFVNVERYGNTSAASVPIALCEAIEAGRVKDGDNLVMVAFGAGLSWGAVTLRWGVPAIVPSRPWWRTARDLLRRPEAEVKSVARRAGRKMDIWRKPTNGNGYYPEDGRRNTEDKRDIEKAATSALRLTSSASADGTRVESPGK